MYWIGVYNIQTDTFDVWKVTEQEADGYGKRVINFTDHEQELVEKVADGRNKFNWKASWDKLTEGSKAYWAMM